MYLSLPNNHPPLFIYQMVYAIKRCCVGNRRTPRAESFSSNLVWAKAYLLERRESWFPFTEGTTKVHSKEDSSDFFQNQSFDNARDMLTSFQEFHSICEGAGTGGDTAHYICVVKVSRVSWKHILEMCERLSFATESSQYSNGWCNIRGRRSCDWVYTGHFLSCCDRL